MRISCGLAGTTRDFFSSTIQKRMEYVRKYVYAYKLAKGGTPLCGYCTPGFLFRDTLLFLGLILRVRRTGRSVAIPNYQSMLFSMLGCSILLNERIFCRASLIYHVRTFSHFCTRVPSLAGMSDHEQHVHLKSLARDFITMLKVLISSDRSVYLFFAPLGATNQDIVVGGTRLSSFTRGG